VIPAPAGCYLVGKPASAVAFIRDNDTNTPPPAVTVTVDAIDPDATEIPLVPPWLDIPQRIDDAVFRINRTGDTGDALTVFFRLSGTASNGVDYAKIGESITIPAGSSFADVVVDPIDDFLVEGTETVILTVQPPVCVGIYPPPPGCYQVGLPRTALAYIHDDDTNLTPKVVITQPADNSGFVYPTSVHIEAEVTDPDGYSSQIEFLANGRVIGE